MKNNSFGQKILNFNNNLRQIDIQLIEGYRLINPFSQCQKKQIDIITQKFYETFYNDYNKRRMILGSSPARRGTAITGIPYEDAQHIQEITGIIIDNYHTNKASGNFLYEVMEKYGGCEKFYKNFYLNFVCPLGIVKKMPKGNEVNCNYYEKKEIQEKLYDFIVSSIKEQLNFGIDTSVCYCIGSGENYKFLRDINQKFNFFQSIIPLEHPRFIMQYNSKNKDFYMNKYIQALTLDISKEKTL